MDKVQFGLIGCGTMGGALACAAVEKIPGSQWLLSGRNFTKPNALAKKIGASVTDNVGVASRARYILLGVKPQVMPTVLAEIAPALAARAAAFDPFVLVSMAAGISSVDICRMLEADYPVLRIMPNTPAAIGEGMITYCSREVSEVDVEFFLQVMKPAGRFDEIPEHLMDAASAVAGCSPAFVYQFIEALADGGVQGGLPRTKALEYAAAAVQGAAAMVLATGSHPGQLKDAVCSPGGSTIAGVHALEKGCLRGTVMDAVAAAIARNKELGKT